MGGKQPAPLPCLGSCGRMVRPSLTALSAWPGTVGWYAAGMCKPCFRAVGVRQRGDRIRPCERCNVLTRSRGIPKVDAPETVLRIGDLCEPCHNAGGRVTPERVEYIKQEIEAYLRSRGRVDAGLKEAS